MMIVKRALLTGLFAITTTATFAQAEVPAEKDFPEQQRSQPHRPSAEERANKTADHLKEKLDLTDAQRGEVYTSTLQHLERLGELKQQVREEKKEEFVQIRPEPR